MKPSKATFPFLPSQLASLQETQRITFSHLIMLERNVQRAYKELMSYKGAGEHAAGILDEHVGCADWPDLEQDD